MEARTADMRGIRDIPFETGGAHKIPREDFETTISSTFIGELGTA